MCAMRTHRTQTPHHGQAEEWAKDGDRVQIERIMSENGWMDGCMMGHLSVAEQISFDGGHRNRSGDKLSSSSVLSSDKFYTFIRWMCEWSRGDKWNFRCLEWVCGLKMCCDHGTNIFSIRLARPFALQTLSLIAALVSIRCTELLPLLSIVIYREKFSCA